MTALGTEVCLHEPGLQLYLMREHVQPVSMSALVILVRIYALLVNADSKYAAEDAPAPTALHSFQARVENGKILVTADPESTQKKNMSRQPKLLASGYQASNKPGVVIVGGGSGAFHAIESLREVSIYPLLIAHSSLDATLTDLWLVYSMATTVSLQFCQRKAMLPSIGTPTSY